MVSQKRKKRNVDIILFIVLALGAVTMLLPLAWMISTSLKPKTEVLAIPPQWIPKNPQWDNYIKVFQMTPLLNGFINTIIVALSVTVVGTLSSSMAAFAFSKLNFKGKNKMFLALLGTIMIPFPVVMIPQFVLFTKLGWIDTLLPLIIPGLFGSVMTIFFLRQYMFGLPNSLIDAAKIDGCSYTRIFFKIILPLVKPALATQIILGFMGCWNDYLGPSIYLNTPEHSTVQVLIASFNSMYAIQSDYGLIMAASVISMVPILVIFALFQKQIIESIAITGIK
ncbi:carbohydrate ABC transporter permease [Clostridium hydrogenum]|uniref:carbohydrate ABC transporter permease n=1 Tax=Clostridium hydrogenum TaxID=2855764 RepID=UPI001F45F3F4|nr:carbohydrate ABC transporter permease [Clostridium hydrogenum]